MDVKKLSLEEAKRWNIIRNKDRGHLWYFRLSKIFNEDWERYKRSGMTQEKLGKQYGFTRSSISLILPIFPRLKEVAESADISAFSNYDLTRIATVESKIFRKALVERAKDKPSV